MLQNEKTTIFNNGITKITQPSTLCWYCHDFLYQRCYKSKTVATI